MQKFEILFGLVIGLFASSALSGRIRDSAFIGSSVLDEVPLIDGHNDFPYSLLELEQNLLNNFTFNSDLRLIPKWAASASSHTDLPRLRQGKVGGQFWVAFVGCDTDNRNAVALTLAQIDVIKRLIALNPNDLKYVTTADGITEAFREGKIASLVCVEGGHSIDSRLSVLRLYYELGVRYMTLTHSCNLPWADQSASDNEGQENIIKVGGLSEWGESVVLEMNRLGMMVDLSHVSRQVMIDALEVSVAPVIFSHSSAYGVFAHVRNVDDEVLLKVKANNGIVMVNFFTAYITAEPTSTIGDVIRHLNHIRDVAGIDHVGIGADYNGVTSVPVGLEDVSRFPALFDALAENGWFREDLKKLAGLNLIRVFKQVEAVRDSFIAKLPEEQHIPDADLTASGQNFECRSDFQP